MANHMSLVVMALQGAVLLTLVLTPTELPPRITLFELLWAAAREPEFYPLVALIGAGPVLTVMACQVRGGHRPWLAVTWGAFLVALLVGFGDRVALMLRILWWQVSG